MGQQRYTDEFRREAVRQVVEKGHAVKDVAERLGVIQRLRHELKRVTEERNILKKAAAYFAKASG